MPKRPLSLNCYLGYQSHRKRSRYSTDIPSMKPLQRVISSALSSSSSSWSFHQTKVFNGFKFTSSIIEDLKVLCKNNSLEISDLECFKNITLHSNRKLAWLKDSVVSAYCNMVHRSCNNQNFITNPLWYKDLRSCQKLDSCSIYELLSKQKTTNYDILHQDNVFFPIAMDNQHWLLLRPCRINATITTYDSLLHQHNNNKFQNLFRHTY